MSDDRFAERLARIAQKNGNGPEAQDSTGEKAKVKRTAGTRRRRHAQSGLAGLVSPGLAFGLVTVAAVAVFIWYPREVGTNLLTSPLELVAADAAGDSDFERCINDPVLLADLASRGSSNPRNAAILWCR